jgi:hypothetical protein
VKGSARGKIADVLTRHFPGWIEENHKELESGYLVFWPEI